MRKFKDFLLDNESSIMLFIVILVTIGVEIYAFASYMTVENKFFMLVIAIVFLLLLALEVFSNFDEELPVYLLFLVLAFAPCAIVMLFDLQLFWAVLANVLGLCLYDKISPSNQIVGLASGEVNRWIPKLNLVGWIIYGIVYLIKTYLII